MRIALLADPHLSDVERTPQEEALNWALNELSDIKPDACVWLGDITACGSPDAAMRFCKKIKELPFPSVTVPGNSDLRTEHTASLMERYLLSHIDVLKIGDLDIVAMDTSQDTILPCERTRLSKLSLGSKVLLCSHQPAKYLDSESLEFLKNWIAEQSKNGCRFLLWASGHRHVYETGEFEGIPTVSIRALDLDKCIRGSAQICVWDSENKDAVKFEERVYSKGLISEWSSEERQEFADFLGITCYNRYKTERDMPFAIQNRVRHLEWESIAENEISLIEEWRRIGGKSLSLHMPALQYETGTVDFSDFREMGLNAVRAGADMITVHPPRIACENMQIGSSAYEAIADATADAFLPVASAGIDILVENNHTDFGTPKDPMKCAYGCSPLDLVEWRDALIKRLGKGTCHIRFDIGHARNNEPLSENYPIGKWYALIGSEARAYHLHQTFYDKIKHRMENHHPITHWHDGMVSFDGFLWAWHASVLHHGPVILEVREGDGAPSTWERLHNLILQNS